MGLASYFETKGDKGIVIFAGKGGLGKTTCSAGLSHYMASKRKRNVLCFSTDPQASLSDIFDRDIFGKGLVSVIPNLDVVEIDAARRVADYQAEVKQKILTMYGLTELPAEIEEYIDSTSAEPAMYESATYDAMADLVSTSGHDLYVFDMPPFGHGVRMIAMAEILSKWVGKITEAREKAQEYEAVAATLKGTKGSEDEVLKELQDIQAKITRFGPHGRPAAHILLHGPAPGAHGDPGHGARARDVRRPRPSDGGVDREPGVPCGARRGERRRSGRVPPEPRPDAAEISR